MRQRGIDMDDFLTRSANRGAGGQYRDLALYSAVAAFLAHVIVSSRLAELAPSLELLRLASLGVILISSVIGVCLCLDPKRIGAGLVSVAFLIAVPLAVYNFDVRTGQPFVWSSGGIYYGIGLVGLFVALTRQAGGMDRFVRIAFAICAAYLIIYLVVAQLIGMGYLAVSENSMLLLGEDKTSGRSARMVMASAYVVFPFAVSVVAILKKFHWGHAIVIALAIGCFFFAQSRVISLIVVMVFGTFYLTRKIGAMGAISFGIFFAALLASLVITFSTINPFNDMASDLSGWARYKEIDYVQRTVHNYWISGAGVAAGESAYAPMTRVKFFYPADIGLIGQYFTFGIAGLFLYTAQAYGACFSSGSLTRLGVDPRLAVGLALTGIIFTSYSILAAVFAGGSATVFGALFLALLPYSPVIGFWREIRRRSAYKPGERTTGSRGVSLPRTVERRR
jgi:hypothetical protein